MKILTAFVICCMTATSLSAQKIHFTDTSNVWHNLIVTSTGGSPDFSYWTDQFIADTTIGTLNYRMFSFGCIREDTVEKKVYFKGIDSDFVFIDYNLHTGDSFRVNAIFDNHFWVTGVDSTLINSVWYKVWYFGGQAGDYPYYCQTQVIEGLGCTKSPAFMLTGGGMPGEWDSYMYCFSTRHMTPPISPPVGILDNDTSCATFPELAVSNYMLKNTGYRVYPNPARNELNISSDRLISEIELNNFIGQTINTQHFSDKNIKLNIANLTPGIYFLKIDGSQFVKFIKTN